MANEKYFKKSKDSLIFTSKTLEVYVPVRYGQHGCLDVSENVQALGIFDMVIDGTVKSGMLLPAKITMKPNNIETILRDGERHLKLTFLKDDVFIVDTHVVQDEHIAYVMFYEFVYGGKVPKFMTYDQLGFIFEKAEEVTGIKFPTNSAVFEMMNGALHRDATDLNKFYRLTDMKKDPLRIPLRTVAHAATSTTTKIVGSYDNEGFDAALVNAADTPSEIENLLRR